jgi:hypothetical protein
MPTLHIEHTITDFDTWSSAFGRFAEIRRRAGVREQRIQRPAGDPNYVVVDLDFSSRGEAEAFLRFVTTQVWGIPQNAPALAGAPKTMILEPAPATPSVNGSGTEGEGDG